MDWFIFFLSNLASRGDGKKENQSMESRSSPVGETKVSFATSTISLRRVADDETFVSDSQILVLQWLVLAQKRAPAIERSEDRKLERRIQKLMKQRLMDAYG